MNESCQKIKSIRAKIAKLEKILPQEEGDWQYKTFTVDLYFGGNEEINNLLCDIGGISIDPYNMPLRSGQLITILIDNLKESLKYWESFAIADFREIYETLNLDADKINDILKK